MDFDNRKVYGDTFISDGLVSDVSKVCNYVSAADLMMIVITIHNDDDKKD